MTSIQRRERDDWERIGVVLTRATALMLVVLATAVLLALAYHAGYVAGMAVR